MLNDRAFTIETVKNSVMPLIKYISIVCFEYGTTYY